mmetsp:Transcript_6629/g.20140  ORF Transcript_6629/g.20140 Transcript_6629/m.20140 type:complete len:213 (-) Transcript_6629:196-834(-)
MRTDGRWLLLPSCVTCGQEADHRLLRVARPRPCANSGRFQKLPVPPSRLQQPLHLAERALGLGLARRGPRLGSVGLEMVAEVDIALGREAWGDGTPAGLLARLRQPRRRRRWSRGCRRPSLCLPRQLITVGIAGLDHPIPRAVSWRALTSRARAIHATQDIAGVLLWNPWCGQVRLAKVLLGSNRCKVAARWRPHSRRTMPSSVRWPGGHRR